MTEVDIIFRAEADADLGDRLQMEVISRAANDEKRHTRRPVVAVSDLAGCWDAILDTLISYRQRATVKRLTCRIEQGTGSDAGQQALKTLVEVAAHETGAAVVWGEHEII